MTGVLVGSERFENMQETWGGRPNEHGKKLEVMLPQAKTTSRTASNQHKLEAKKDSSLETKERAWPYWHLDFRLLVSTAVREYISIVLSHILFLVTKLYSTLLWPHGL